MPYDINGRGIDREDDARSKRLWTLFVALLTAIVMLAIAVSACTSQPEPAIAIDTSDEQLMHELGLPTKADVEMWREVHRWGYSTENVMHTEHIYTELPGRNDAAWFALYGLEG